MCRDYNFIFYDDNDCELFIKNNFDENVYKAYMSINSVYGAMKADFFRYCILYKNGGVYLDIDSVILRPLDELIRDDELINYIKINIDKIIRIHETFFEKEENMIKKDNIKNLIRILENIKLKINK